MDARTPRKPDIMAARYKRILLKLSGEALQGQQGYGVDAEVQVLALGTTEVEDAFHVLILNFAASSSEVMADTSV